MASTTYLTQYDKAYPTTEDAIERAQLIINLSISNNINLLYTANNLQTISRMPTPQLSEEQCKQLARTSAFSLVVLLNVFSNEDAIWLA